VNKEMILKAMDRIEVLLSGADILCDSGSIKDGEIQHLSVCRWSGKDSHR
jgi:hypothetical protein